MDACAHATTSCEDARPTKSPADVRHRGEGVPPLRREAILALLLRGKAFPRRAGKMPARHKAETASPRGLRRPTTEAADTSIATAIARRSLPASRGDAGQNPPWRTKDVSLYKA